MGIGEEEGVRPGLVDLGYADGTELIDMLQQDPREILAALMAAPSGGFLRWMSQHLQETLGLDFAFVGELSGEDWTRIQTLEVCRRGQTLDNFAYELKDTPCSDVMERGICYCPAGVAAAYPRDLMLVDMGLESYVGISLFDDADVPIGIAALMHSEPISDERGRAAAAMLRVYRPRIQAELSYRSAVRTMELAASEALTSQSTLEGLVEVLAHSTHMRTAFVAVRSATKPGHASTLAMVEDRKRVANIDYELAGSPCERIGPESSVAIPEGLQALYPDNTIVTAYRSQAYFGVAITDLQGEHLGQICLLHDRPLRSDLLANPLVRLLVSRLTAEVRRREVERERAALERGLMDAKRNESIGSLASGIAHDFNNLLFAISGQANILHREGEGDVALQEQLQTILDASAQATDLCEQLLTYAGRRSSDVSEVDLNQVIRRCQSVAKMFAAGKADLIAVFHSSALPIVGSETRLQQVVMNLVKNAADAIGRDGTIRIETSLRERHAGDFQGAILGCEAGAGMYATLRISDDGCGMEPEQLRRAFEPFFTTKTIGHGLGLAVVCGSIEEHGGALEIESRVGVGTIFTVSFPLLKAPGVGDEAGGAPPRHEVSVKSVSAEPHRARRILIIDDDRLVRSTLVAILANESMQTEIAVCGADGISMFRELHQDLDAVILDYTMPGMNGEQTLIALREISRAVPVLMSSGNIGPRDIAEFAEKPDAFLAKPFARELLLNELHLLSKR